MKTEISKDTQLQVGDIIELHFNVAGGIDWDYFRAVQIKAIENKLESSRPEYQIQSWESLADKVIFTIKIVQPDNKPDLQTAGVGSAAIVAVAIIGAGVFTWLSLGKIYKITDGPAGKVLTVGIGAAGIGFLIYMILRTKS